MKQNNSTELSGEFLKIYNTNNLPDPSDPKCGFSRIVPGWFMAHGSWLMAERGRPSFGISGSAWPVPGPGGALPSPGAGPAPLGHEPRSMSNELSSMHQASGIKLTIRVLIMTR